jgi:hypothetical protein
MRICDTASLLGPAARGAARLLLATPRRLYIGAGAAALVAGIGANALLLQIGRHPVPLLAPVANDHLPASTNTTAPAEAVETVASDASSTPISEYSTAPAVAGHAAAESRATEASAPDITSSIERATQDKQHQSLAPQRERRSAALGPDQIGALLRDKPVDGGSHLVRAAQTAPKTAPPGALFAILSARTAWSQPPKSAQNSSSNLQPQWEVDAAAGRAGLLMNPIAIIILVVATRPRGLHTFVAGRCEGPTISRAHARLDDIEERA